jgi:membrane protein
MVHITASGLLQVLKKSGRGFINDKVPKKSASLAYYTVFSIGPMLLVMIFLSNLFWRQQAVEGMIVSQLQDFIGHSAAYQVQEIIRNASIDTNSAVAATLGFVTLFIGATTVFTEIQDSVNMIWNLKLKPSNGWWKLVLSRIVSFSIVVALGFLLLVSLVINGLLEGFMGKIKEVLPSTAVIVIYAINILITLLVTTTLFALIYKVLPDAHIKWKDVFFGAVFTALLFMLSRFGITFYIGRSEIGSTYGAAGSLVVLLLWILLLWIYFSSMILYFGAEFTKHFAVKFGSEIKPNSYTVLVQNVSLESRDKTVQQNERELETNEKDANQKRDVND